jgi:hypothetical protein
MSENDQIELNLRVTAIRQEHKFMPPNPFDFINPEKVVFPNLPLPNRPQPDPDFVSITVIDTNMSVGMSFNFVHGEITLRTEDTRRINLQVGDQIKVRVSKG